MSTIGIDLDGVCYEFGRTARYLLREYRGIDLPPVTEWDDWNFAEKYVPAKDWDWLWGGGVKKGLFRYGHMVKGCRIGLEALVKAKHKIVIVTHRPENATSDTLEWAGLYFKNIPLSGFHLMSSRNPKSNVDFDVLIDDKPDNIEDAIGHARGGILFDQPYNQHAIYKWPARATWHNMEEAISERNRIRPS